VGNVWELFGNLVGISWEFGGDLRGLEKKERR